MIDLKEAVVEVACLQAHDLEGEDEAEERNKKKEPQAGIRNNSLPILTTANRRKQATPPPRGVWAFAITSHDVP